MTDNIPHVSQLGQMEAARFQQDLQDILLCIIAQQGAPVRIPLSMAQAVAETHRLKFVRTKDADTGQEYVDLSVEKADVLITPQQPKVIM